MDSSEAVDLETVVNSGRLGPSQYLIISICSLVAMIDGFDTQCVAFVAPEIASSWHVEPSQFGPVFGAGLLGGMLGAMALGLAGDRLGRKPVLMFSVALFAICSLLTPFATSIGNLTALRFVTGLGLGGALPTAIALTSEYTPTRLRATVVALMFCGFPLGAVIGGFAMAKLLPVLGWTSAFYAGGVIPLLLMPLIVGWVPESIRFLALKGDSLAIISILDRMNLGKKWNVKLTVETPAPLFSLFAKGTALGTILLWITFFFSLMLSYFLLNWIPMLARQGGHSVEEAVVAVAMINLGAIIGCLTLGQLAGRYGQATVIGAGYGLGAVAIVAIGYVGTSSTLLLIFSVLAGILTIGAQMCTVALCAGFYDTRLRATGVGWTMGIGRIGAILGPVLGGVLIGAGFTAPTFFLIAGLTSLGAAATVFAMGWFVLRGRSSSAQKSDLRAQIDALEGLSG
ncbi:MFS transporter [Bradyrhizobium genosp. P]|uniref:MFS transporter n=1 Tax=Bradyrhizobium genosp. P TaxID=83641 RepID=UPI003CF52FD4